MRFCTLATPLPPQVILFAKRLGGALGCAVGLLAGCVGTPHAHRIIGPDGTPMLHVACARDPGACFELAGRNCPRGYEITPVLDIHSNQFLVVCRNRTAGSAEERGIPAERLGESASLGWASAVGTSGIYGPWSKANSSLGNEAVPRGASHARFDLGY